MLQAAFVLVNQQFRLQPRLLMIWRGFGAALLGLPLLVWYGHIPTNPLFYFVVLINGVLVGIGDRQMFHNVLHLGAGSVSRLIILTLPLAFTGWQLLHPESLSLLLAKPHAWLLAPALLGTLASLYLLKRDPVSAAALWVMLPNILVYAVVDILNKTAFLYGHGFGAYLSYIITVSFIAGLLNLLWPTPGAEPLQLRSLFTPQLRRGGSLIAGVVVIFSLLKTASFANAPNPALPAALILTSPLWVLLWHRLRGIPDATSLWAGLGCLGSALLLVLATL